MTEKVNELDPIALLSKRIDEQSRLSNILTVVCCLAIIASIFYSMASMIGIVPNLVLTKFLGNIEVIETRWHMLQKTDSVKP